MMGRVVFVLLLASCFATGLGLQCYQCVSDISVLIDGIGSLPFISNDCNSASFDPDGVATMTVTGSDDMAVPLLKAEYCIKMVISFEGLVGVTIRSGVTSASILNPGDLITDGIVNNSRQGRDSLLDDLLPSSDILDTITGFFANPPAPLGDVDVSLCDSNLCNSVSGLGHSNALLAMVVVVVIATLANTFN